MFVRRVFNLSVKPRHGGQLYCCQVPPVRPTRLPAHRVRKPAREDKSARSPVWSGDPTPASADYRRTTAKPFWKKSLIRWLTVGQPDAAPLQTHSHPQSVSTSSSHRSVYVSHKFQFLSCRHQYRRQDCGRIDLHLGRQASNPHGCVGSIRCLPVGCTSVFAVRSAPANSIDCANPGAVLRWPQASPVSHPSPLSVESRQPRNRLTWENRIWVSVSLLLSIRRQ